MTTATPIKSTALWQRHGLILMAIWGLVAIADITWLGIDHTEPAWDQGAHLSAALSHWQLFQQPQIFSGDWWNHLWTQLWTLSPTYRGPFIYLLTVPFLQIWGLSADSATLVNELFSAIIMATIYVLGRQVWDARTGLWAAGFCALSPALAFNRLDYLLDFGLTALILVAYTLLTLGWIGLGAGTPSNPQIPALQGSKKFSTGWWLSLGYGVVLGWAILAKPTSLLFLLMPMMGLVCRCLRRGSGWGGLQLVLALLIAGWIPSGWFRQNWLTILTSMIGSNAVGKGEGDPSFTTWQGWVYYIRLLPDLMSWPLLGVAIATLILLAIHRFRRSEVHAPQPHAQEWRWLISFVLSTYVLCTLATNKDLRFILPITPVLILMAVRLMLTLWVQPWMRSLRWGIVGVSGLLLIAALFPLPGAGALSNQHLASATPRWPAQEVVQAVYAAEPYLQSNLGMLVDTPQIQAFNLDFYGKLANFQVSARQLGLNRNFIDLDARSLSWYLAKTGHQGSWVDHPIITPLRQRVERDTTSGKDYTPTLALYRTWPLPDHSTLQLYHRRQPAVTLEPLAEAVALSVTRVEVAPQAQAGSEIPVVYEISGSGVDLQQGILLLTWKRVGGSEFCSHDHAIGLGQIAPNPLQPLIAARITERIALGIPKSLPAGMYRLAGLYLNRRTQQVQPLPIPKTQLQVLPASRSAPAEVPSEPSSRVPPDLVTQLHALAQRLAEGNLDGLFESVGPLNQYDPTQDYLKVAELAATYRWQQNPQDFDAAYTLVLATVLQYKADQTLRHLTRLTQLDPKNPYAWAYLAFINLYQWRPDPALAALKQVEALRPIPELRILKLVANAMKGNLLEVWSLSQASP